MQARDPLALMAGLQTIRSIPSENVRNRALQPVTDLLQGVQRYILLTEFETMQG